MWVGTVRRDNDSGLVEMTPRHNHVGVTDECRRVTSFFTHPQGSPPNHPCPFTPTPTPSPPPPQYLHSRPPLPLHPNPHSTFHSQPPLPNPYTLVLLQLNPYPDSYLKTPPRSTLLLQPLPSHNTIPYPSSVPTQPKPQSSYINNLPNPTSTLTLTEILTPTHF